MAAADPWIVYDNFLVKKNDGTIDLDTGTFSVLLFLVGYVPNTATDTTYTALGTTHEVATAFGYTQGGQPETPSLTPGVGTVRFSLTDPVWNAAGGDITARYAVIVDDVTDQLVAYSLLDSAVADVTATDGNTFTIDIATNGVFDEDRV